ncbi:unnamed protein product [Pedinophyceae sp. YPF-701]|nr:unnamed protein product [Pedinophyceae sp. YPF-701]
MGAEWQGARRGRPAGPCAAGTELETVYARVYAYGHRVTDVFEEHPEKRAHWEGKIFDCRQANYMCLRNLVVAPFHEDMKAQGLRGFLVLHVDAYANPLKWRDVAPDAYVLPTQPKSSEEPMLDRVNNCWPWEYIKRDDPSAAWWRWTGWGPDGVMGDDLTGDVIANAKDRGWLPPEFPRQGEFSLWDDMKFLGVDLAAGYVAMTGLFEGRELYHDPAMHVVWRGVQHGFGGRCVALPTLGGCCNYILISDGSTHWYPWAHKWGLHDIEQREAYLDLVRRVRSYMDLLDERPAEVPLGAAPGDWEAAYPDYNDVVGRYESMGGGVAVHEGAGADDGGAVREEAVGVDDDGGAEAGEAQHGSGDADGAGSDAPEGGAEVVRI